MRISTNTWTQKCLHTESLVCNFSVTQSTESKVHHSISNFPPKVFFYYFVLISPKFSAWAFRCTVWDFLSHLGLPESLSPIMNQHHSHHIFSFPTGVTLSWALLPSHLDFCKWLVSNLPIFLWPNGKKPHSQSLHHANSRDALKDSHAPTHQ